LRYLKFILTHFSG